MHAEVLKFSLSVYPCLFPSPSSLSLSLSFSLSLPATPTRHHAAASASILLLHLPQSQHFQIMLTYVCKLTSIHSSPLEYSCEKAHLFSCILKCCTFSKMTPLSLVYSFNLWITFLILLMVTIFHPFIPFFGGIKLFIFFLVFNHRNKSTESDYFLFTYIYICIYHL